MPNTGENINEQGIPNLTFTVSASNNVQAPVDKTLTIAEQAAEAKATGDAINVLAADIADLATDLSGVEARTGESILLGTTTGEVTIKEAIDDLGEEINDSKWPVGSIFMTISENMPDFFGTWIEILLPVSWGDLKNGTRNYKQVNEGDTTGPVHFWLRIA